MIRANFYHSTIGTLPRATHSAPAGTRRGDSNRAADTTTSAPRGRVIYWIATAAVRGVLFPIVWCGSLLERIKPAIVKSCDDHPPGHQCEMCASPRTFFIGPDKYCKDCWELVTECRCDSE